MAKHEKVAMDSINKEFTMLLQEKRAIAPVKRKYIPRKYLKNRVRSSAFLKEKMDGNNVFEKLKTRVVADGSTQDKMIYSPLNSPTVKLESIFVCLALVSGRKTLHWGEIDIGGAYLNAFMVDGDVIIMVLSKQLTSILVRLKPHLKEYVDPLTGTMVVQILKALYGLVQSAALWFDALSSFLTSLRFKQNSLDECVMMLHTEFGMLIIILYVDDILMLADRKILITWLERELEDEYETIVIDTSDTFTYLGMVVAKDENCVINMHMIGYIENILVD